MLMKTGFSPCDTRQVAPTFSEKQELLDLGYSEDEAAEMRVELACGSQLWVDEFRNLGVRYGWHPSAFEAADTFPALMQELNGHSKILRNIDDRLTTTQALVPKALGKMKCEIPGHEADVKSALDKLLEDSAVIKEQVGTIIDRLHESANEAMAFNDLMHRQFEFKGNRLPEEVSEFSGTVVSNLHRAEDMAKKEMVAGAKDLVRMAEEVRTMIMASAMPAPLCMLGAPPIQRRPANAAGFL
ncbi:unnamed protein product [Symbiodinium pilosum]|uniref:Uncharacterized protein n=1 Tax=Symbiodinium pilosum TaxID=2952 RepID=A0A812JD72_SYMPI|nr:unnamed protein product [Symbiodinium pilosum]